MVIRISKILYEMGVIEQSKNGKEFWFYDKKPYNSEEFDKEVSKRLKEYYLK